MARKEHWKLLGNLKTTVEGLVSINNPNVWSKYGGLERISRDMHSILYHGLIPDKVCCRQKDYWQFVKDIRRLSPHAAQHVEKVEFRPGLEELSQAVCWRVAQTRPKTCRDSFPGGRAKPSFPLQLIDGELKLRDGGCPATSTPLPFVVGHGRTQQPCWCFLRGCWVRGIARPCPGPAAACFFTAVPPVFQFISLHENGQCSPDGFSNRAVAELWLQHSLQFHCLSAQLKPLLGNKQYIRKFYADSAFLLSDAHVAVMLQCLEAVEQNNPRLLAQIDTSMHLPGEHRDPFGRSSLAASAPRPLGEQCATAGWRELLSQLPPCEDGQLLLREPKELPSVVLSLAVSHVAMTSENASRFARKSEASVPVTKSQSLTALPGSVCTPPTECTAHRYFGSFSGLRSASAGIQDRRLSSTLVCSSAAQPQENAPCASSHWQLEGRCPQRLATPLPQLTVSSPKGSSSPAGEMSADASADQADDPWAGGQDDADGPEYLAIGNLGRHSRACSSQSGSSTATTNSAESSTSNLFSSSSSQKRGSFSSLGEQGTSGDAGDRGSGRGTSLLRRSSFSEGQASAPQRMLKGGHVRSHSDTNVAFGKSHDADIKRSTAPSKKTFLSSGSTSFHSFLHSTSAEAVAMGLLRQFEGMQLPAASELEWLVAEHDAPQKEIQSLKKPPWFAVGLQGSRLSLRKLFKRPNWYKKRQLSKKLLLLLPIPDSVPISPDDGEHADIYKLRIRVRGNLEWAPPRPQIIFNIHPAPTRKVSVAKQNYRCAGCGIRTDPDYIKRMRYCEYLGKYFCQCCHENSQMVIPSRILRKWDFSKYYVSNFSKDLLSKIWSDPLFNVQDINAALYRKVKPLNQVRLLRIQLYHMKNMFKTCRFAKALLDAFDAVPGHLTEDLHLYSLNDLSATKKGEIVPRLTELLKAGTLHVEKCMLCQAKGFICEFCQNEDDIIFPFELNKCRTCEECKACYHKVCFRSGPCPKCERLQARRELLAKQSMEADISDYEEEEEEEEEEMMAAAATT
ncbi:hypothetical protein lerEdw1_005105 [Lerista edwardsae]|nr:hypothetical protein lerEdw1_005105 [Lerista edwardsae]